MNPIKNRLAKAQGYVSRRDFIRAGTLLATNVIASHRFNLRGETYREAAKESPLQIAFLADIHYHDVYATFEDGSFQGIKGLDGRHATIRTMSSQLSSTRLFNENYFAFKAALDRIVARGIKLVVLAGDFSDDGQPVHVRGLKRVLDDYTARYGLRFLVTFGNHDPVKPFGQPHGKPDFLGEGGKQQPVSGPEMRALGYEGLLEYMGSFGPYPKKEDIYWECPFTNYSYAEYTFERAFSEARFENRMYDAQSIRIPDLSYLVEPVEGVWLLGIDANVFMLSQRVDSDNPENPANFAAAGNAGWNRMLVEKKDVLTWIKSVAARAAALNKQLIAFSHYPMLDTMRGAGPDIAAFLKAGREQPTAETMCEIAATGLRLHFGGHLHKNNTAVYKSEDAFLVDVQIPSTAAYMPAFKILTLHPDNCMEIETVVLNDVPDFDKLFEHYRVEHEHLAQIKSPALWNAGILESKNYHEFTQWHLSELTRQRYLPREWPAEMRDFLESNSSIDGLEIATDFYRLLNAGGSLAAGDMKPRAQLNDSRFSLFLNILDKLSGGLPNDHFMIDFNNQTIVPV